MRITGLATGLDMDKIVSDSMKPYRMRIDQTQQKKEIVEMKQMLYRDVIKDSQDLYYKYFDISKPDSLLHSSSYGVTKFTSSNENVLSVKAGAEAKAGNYTITGTTGTAAKSVVTEGIAEGEKIVLNGKEFTLVGSTQKEIADNLNKDIKKSGIDVSVRYSDFAGTTTGNKKGLIFESTVLGKDSTFTLGGTLTEAGIKNPGTNATAATINGFNVTDLKGDIEGDPTKAIEINGKKIELGDIADKSNKEIEQIIQEKIKEHNNTAEADNKIKVSVKINETSGAIAFESTVLGVEKEETKINIGTNKGDYKNGENATRTKNTIDLDSIRGEKISVNGTVIDLSKSKPGEEIEYLNKILESQGIEAKMDRGAVVLTSKKAGSDSEINVSVFDATDSTEVSGGRDAEITFTDSKGGVYKHTGTSNTVTLDGVTFKFTGEIPTEGITVNGKTDTKDTKDKLVKFVEDYNVLMEKLNKMTMEKPNKKYQPLTEEQKKEMSESEVKLWNEKVKQGQERQYRLWQLLV